MSKYFIGISISELQHLFADNELPLLTDRVTYYKNCPDDSIPSDFDPGSIFNSLPAFSLDDPAGVLIVEISGPRTWEADDDPNIRYLTMSGVKQFIPLTEDARVALSIQWSDVIKLSEAIFEHEFTRFRINKKSISACKAGNLFANIFIDHKQSKFAASRLFTDSLPRALMAAEHKKQDEIGKTFDRQVETWVERAFGDIRKYDKGNKLLDIKDKADSLKSIAVVGLMLRNVEVEAVRVLTERLGKRWKILETKANDDTKSLAPVYSDEIFSRLDINFNINQNGNESINLVTLALFLRWKMAFHNQRSKVDMLSILDDVKSLTGIVDVKLVSNALWMMGAYLGMENIAHTHHHLNKEKYPTLKFAHSVESLGKVRTSIPRTKNENFSHLISMGYQ
ncbi:hypothetical protein AL345_06520 [Aeromonas caviae]|uniref:hypothetical protein n=1 Tax=Aeromonas caviae TaxID=648 RepID=UPI0006A593A4|nr:hypothetical protein [Aeromonas caviae]KOG93950.1 hypothetical protein AL345_06520 [Aeromonas caviae]